MPDVSRYSLKESFNRFYRLFRGDTPPSDAPESLPGTVYSEDEAWSRIAELFAGSIAGETLVLPTALADAISAIRAHEYGEIYTSTGTVTMSVGTSLTKVTGSFHVNGLSSDNIVPDFNDDRIIINDTGTFFVAFQLAFSGANSVTYTLQGYLDSVAQPQIKTIRRLNSNGDVGSCSAIGLIIVTGTNTPLEIYVQAGAGSSNFAIEAGQLYVEKAPV
jgi:hypothetical protein